jgi:hypothetical protein
MRTTAAILIAGFLAVSPTMAQSFDWRRLDAQQQHERDRMEFRLKRHQMEKMQYRMDKMQRSMDGMQRNQSSAPQSPYECY